MFCILFVLSLRSRAQMVHFRRHVLSREDFPKWSASNYPLCPLVVKQIPGKIDDPSDASIVDFANPNLGGMMRLIAYLSHFCISFIRSYLYLYIRFVLYCCFRFRLRL
jgi:hypothetical protein